MSREYTAKSIMQLTPSDSTTYSPTLAFTVITAGVVNAIDASGREFSFTLDKGNYPWAITKLKAATTAVVVGCW